MEQYIIPARRNDKKQVALRTQDVHKELGLSNRVAAVYCAIRTKKFQRMARVNEISNEGPANAAATVTFEILP